MVFKFLLLITLHVLALEFVQGKRFYITSKGECTGCSFKSMVYQWCYTGTQGHNWDYCSTRPGFSAKDFQCRKDHSCEYHGKSYLWCYLEKGGWDYCSLIEDTSLEEFTLFGKACKSYCNLVNKKYVCLNSDIPDYHYRYEDCSIVNEITSDGAGCKNEIGNRKSFCGYHGNLYQWCYTSTSNNYSYGYCSNSKNDLSMSTRQAQASCPGVVLLEQKTQSYADGSRLVTRVTRSDPDKDRILSPSKVSKTRRIDAHTVLKIFHQDKPSGGPTSGSTEQSYGQIRLDNQGTLIENGVVCTNYQLRINGRNPPNPSTIAHLNIQRDFVGYDKFLRGHKLMIVRGLHHSLKTGGSVHIYQVLLGPSQPRTNALGNISNFVNFEDSSPSP